MKILDKKDIKKMREVCRLTAKTLDYVNEIISNGISTNEIDNAIQSYIKAFTCTSACLNYEGFPKAICTSINDVVCHGLPSEKDILKNGDIVNIDITLIKDGYFGDSSRMYSIGQINDNAQKIIDITYQAMHEGIKQVSNQNTTGDIGFAIERFTTRKGYYPVRDIGGHGIGQEFHLPPFVPSIGKRSKGDKLIANTCLTIEPMINEKSHKYKTFPIENSQISYYRTLDGSLSAQFEHTVLVTENGHEVLTLSDA